MTAKTHHTGGTGHQETDSARSLEQPLPSAAVPARDQFQSGIAQCGPLLLKASLVVAILGVLLTMGTGGALAAFGATPAEDGAAQPTVRATQLDLSVTGLDERGQTEIQVTSEEALANAAIVSAEDAGIGESKPRALQVADTQLARDDSSPGDGETLSLFGSIISKHSDHLVPTQAGQYSVSALFAVLIFHWFAKGDGSAGDSTEPKDKTANSDSGSTTARSQPEKQYVAFTLPSVLPLSQGIREVTHHEIHAFELGLMVGGISAWLLSIGRTETVAGLVVTYLAGTLGFRRFGSKAFKTARLEPWYALCALAVGAALGWAIFIMEPVILSLRYL